MKTETPITESRLISVPEAARLYSFSERIIWRWISEGAVAHHRIGRSVRLSPEDVDAFVAKHRVEPINNHR
ncbi:MAG: helix-turn-helix domain-containing protein [Puniceicoccaceae bacterium]